jgi:hypothetical protein
MDDGHIVEQGNHDELLAAGGAYATLYNARSSPSTEPSTTHSHGCPVTDEIRSNAAASIR